jgi:hypothetical protein
MNFKVKLNRFTFKIYTMRLSRLLAFAAVGVVAGILLTQTDKGNELRRNITDSAGDWGKKLGKLRRRSGEVVDDLMNESGNIARKARQKADGHMA